MRWFLLMALAGCGGKAAPTEAFEPEAFEPETVEPAASPQTPAYAGLFTDGTTWTLSVSAEDVASGRGDAWSPPVTVTCRVARYRDADGVKAVEIRCGDGWPALAGDPLTGAWAMSAAGVWRLRAFPDDGVTPAPPDDYHLIAASPVPGDIEMGMAVEGPAYVTVERDGDAWCYGERVEAMYETTWASMCVAPGGPTRGQWGSETERLTAAKFTRTD